MPLEVIIKPTLLQSINNTPTTKLKATVDLSKISNLLTKFDLLLKVTLTVVTSNTEGNEENNIYEYSQIYRNITEPNITFTTMVLGDIKDSNSIYGLAEGVLVNKK